MELLYVLSGRVIKGRQLGRTMGFPTANVALPADAEKLPRGVYLARLRLKDGRALQGVLNHGRHPTLPGGPDTAEIHLFDFDGDIYGEQVTLEYLVFLRGERVFPNAAALAEQVGRDMAEAREMWKTVEATFPSGR